MEMKLPLAFLYVTATSFVLHCLLADGLPNSAVRLIVTRKGLDYLCEIGPDVIRHFILSQLNHVHVSQLEFQNFSIFSEPTTGLNLESHINGRFCLQVNIFKIGSLCLNMRASLQLAAKIEKGAEGLPFINFTKCSMNIAELNVDGKDRDFISLGLVRVAKFLMNLGLSCGFLEAVAEDTFSTIMSRLKVIKLSDFAEIRLALVSNPEFLKDKIIIEQKGDIHSRNIPSIVPSPEQVSLPQWNEYENCQDKMVCVWVTETVANRAAVVYRRADMFIHNFTNYNVVEDDSFFKLDTNTFSLVMPQLFHRYPDHNLTMTARAKKEPTVNFNNNGALFRIPASVDVYVNRTEEENRLSLAFTMNVNATVNATFGIRNYTDNSTFSLTAKISQIQMTMEKQKSNIGEINFDKINKLSKAFHLLKDHVLPNMNKVAQKGYPVNLKVLKLVEPNLIHYKGGLLLETDFILELT